MSLYRRYIADKLSGLKIRTKMLLLFGGGTAVILLIIRMVHLFGMPFTEFKSEYSQYKDSAVANMQSTADQQKNFLSFWFNERLGDLKVFSSQIVLRTGAKEASVILRDSKASEKGLKTELLHSRLSNSKQLQSVVEQMELLKSAYGQYDLIDLVDLSSGYTIASTDSASIGRKHRLNDLLFPLNGPAWENKVTIAQIPNHEQPSLILATTVNYDDSPNRRAAVIFSIPIEITLQQLLDVERTLGNSGEIILIDMQKTVLTPLKNALPDGSAAEPLKYKLLTRSADFAAWGVDGLIEAKDYRGVPVVSVVRHLRLTPDFAISIIFDRDQSELYEPVRQKLIFSLMISLTGIGAVILLVIIVSRQLALPLEQLSKTASRIEQGDLGARAPEVSGVEGKTLAHAFNAMADHIQTSQENLEQQIKIRTEELQSLSKRQEAILSAVPDIIMEVDSNKVYTWANSSGLEFFGADVVGREAAYYFEGEQDTYQKVQPLFQGVNKPLYIESWQRRKDGEIRLLAWWCKTITNNQGDITGLISTARDITEMKLAQEEKTKLETQLMQAQKMESVGRLAGGVAHDFNNMLSVIIGHADIGLMRLEKSSTVCADLVEIRKAAERSADLTRQLLAFARKQTVEPKILDLNDTISGMLKMLQRLIGEAIQIVWHPAHDLWLVKIDPSQFDQILANLCVNAKDAIEDTGNIIIETRNCTISKNICSEQVDAEPGDYVRLTISDNGRGMNQETISHVFEPFFTTKELGKGTGLGLATVYGAVKQNNGFIKIYSEPDKGTTISIFIPRYSADDGIKKTETPLISSPHGDETILLVEDEPAILGITTRLLGMLGYIVISANTPAEAFKLADTHDKKIHLLITDVIMPDMNGRDLSNKLLSIHPQMKRLFMSGYTADVIAQHGVLDEGCHFIQKPFSLHEIADKVRLVLDEK